MDLRAVIASALAAGLAAASPALAAPKAVCYLVIDQAGDGRHSATGAESDQLDIVSADIASGKKEVVAAIRLKKINPVGDPLAGLNMTWIFFYEIEGVTGSFHLSRGVAPTNPSGSEGFAATFGTETISNATYSVDARSSTLRFRAPREAYRSLTKKSGVLHFRNMSASSLFLSGIADIASIGSASIRDLAPSCLKPA